MDVPVLTAKVRLVKNEISQSNAIPLITISSNRLINMLWFNVSKAADKSRSSNCVGE